MKRHSTILSLCGALLCSASGCLLVHHSTNVVRNKEPLRSVRFESEQAQQYFISGVHELQAHKQNSGMNVSAVAFLFWFSSDSTLSDNAIYNDQITACDINGDNLITMQEAVAYRALVAERVRAMEAKTASSDAKPDAVSRPPDAKPTAATPPPALIHIAAQSSSP